MENVREKEGQTKMFIKRMGGRGKEKERKSE